MKNILLVSKLKR